MTDLQCAIQTPLPLCISATPLLCMHLGGNGGLPTKDLHAGTFLESYNADGDAVRDFCITTRDLAQVYISPCVYKDGFPIELDLRQSRFHDHPACGMKFTVVNGQLILQHIEKSTLASKIPCWHSELCGAWLWQIGNDKIHSLKVVHQSLASLIASSAPIAPLSSYIRKYITVSLMTVSSGQHWSTQPKDFIFGILSFWSTSYTTMQPCCLWWRCLQFYISCNGTHTRETL